MTQKALQEYYYVGRSKQSLHVVGTLMAVGMYYRAIDSVECA